MHKCRLLNSFEDHGGWFSLNSTKKQHRYLLFSPSLGNCLKYKSAQAGGGINRFSTSLALRNGLGTFFKVAVDRLVTSSKKVSPEFANNRKTLRQTLLIMNGGNVYISSDTYLTTIFFVVSSKTWQCNI